MQFRFELMNEDYAYAIANWHYEGLYSFYDMDQDIEDMEELLDPRSWPDRYYAVLNEHDELAGFFCFDQENETITLGLGIKPEYTGQGLGLTFVQAGLEFAQRKFSPARFCLSVAVFNQRAIRVYEKAGFIPDGTFINETNGGQYEFLRMVREA